jgi:hypothetical protein
MALLLRRTTSVRRSTPKQLNRLGKTSEVLWTVSSEQTCAVTLDVVSYEGKPIDIELPTTVDMEVTYTEPGFAGDTATGATKSAQMETGLKVQVPLFVNVGDMIRVDTRSGAYVTRV